MADPATAPAAAPAAALPPAEGERPPSVLPMGVLLLASSGAMVFGTLIAAYLHLRRLTDRWPPQGVSYDLYLANMLVITMALSAVSMEWACHALRRGERRQACAALGVTIGLGVAFLNLLWYTADQARFTAARHAYGLVVTALVGLVGMAVAIGVAYATLMLLRVAGRQLSPAEAGHLRASACYWHFTVAACVAVWYTVAVLK